jgi:hypothetical protein
MRTFDILFWVEGLTARSRWFEKHARFAERGKETKKNRLRGWVRADVALHRFLWSILATLLVYVWAGFHSFFNKTILLVENSAQSGHTKSFILFFGYIRALFPYLDRLGDKGI